MSDNAVRAAEMARLAAATEAAESRKAQVLIDEFVAEVKALGIVPQPLRARGYSGKGRFKTSKIGWYIRSDESVALGENGEYYLMAVWAGFKEKFTGVELNATPPPLIVGRGGGDSETFDLKELLASCLSRYRSERAGQESTER